MTVTLRCGLVRSCLSTGPRPETARETIKDEPSGLDREVVGEHDPLGGQSPGSL